MSVWPLPGARRRCCWTNGVTAVHSQQSDPSARLAAERGLDCNAKERREGRSGMSSTHRHPTITNATLMTCAQLLDHGGVLHSPAVGRQPRRGGVCLPSPRRPSSLAPHPSIAHMLICPPFSTHPVTMHRPQRRSTGQKRRRSARPDQRNLGRRHQSAPLHSLSLSLLLSPCPTAHSTAAHGWAVHTACSPSSLH